MVEDNIMNTAHFAIPDSMHRWYMVAIRKDCYRTGPHALQTCFPATLPYCVGISDIVQPLPSELWQSLPCNWYDGQEMCYGRSRNSVRAQ